MARSLAAGYAGPPRVGRTAKARGDGHFFMRKNEAQPWRGYFSGCLVDQEGFLRNEGDMGTVGYEADRVSIASVAGV
jgi:hypothetical protein